jgi:Delta3-Delta2-enoyl-CoA isomerase
LDELDETILQLGSLPFPTVAAINGHAFGGGLLFALSHDFRFMNSEKGFVCVPAARLNIVLPNSLIDVLK